MKSPNTKAAAELHQFLADPADLSPADLRTALESEGVDVTAFLQRLDSARPPAPVGTPRLDQVAQQTKEKIRGFLAKFKSEGSAGLPEAAFARDGSAHGTNHAAPKKQGPGAARTKSGR